MSLPGGPTFPKGLERRIVPVGTSGAWVEPRMMHLVDEGVAPLGEHVLVVRDAFRRASASVCADWLIDDTAFAFGSSILTRLGAPMGDVDLAVRSRFRPSESYASLDHAHAGVSAAFKRLLVAMVEDLASRRNARGTGMHLLGVTMDWNSAWAEKSPRGATFACRFSPVDILTGFAVVAPTHVTLDEALWNCTGVKIGLIADGADGPIVLDAAVERSFVAPGGMIDVGLDFSAPWMGKVCFDRGDALTACAMEHELGDLFPDRYREETFAPMVLQMVLGDMLGRGHGPAKVGKLIMLFVIAMGRTDLLEKLRPIVSGPAARVSASAARMGLIITVARRGDADADVVLRWAHAALKGLVEEAGRVDAPWASNIAGRAGKVRDTIASPRDHPRGWAEAQELVRMCGAEAEAAARRTLLACPEAVAMMDEPNRSKIVAMLAKPA